VTLQQGEVERADADVVARQHEAARGVVPDGAGERAAETLDAEIAAIVRPDRVVAVVGYPGGAVPVRELTSITAGGRHHELTVPDVGVCRMATVSLDYPPGATFILARAGADADLRHDEASLLRGMARVTSTAMRTQHLLDDERAAREESDRQATENARLLAELTQRQVRLAELANEQAALRRVAVLVAGGAPPEEVFGAVAGEVGRLLEVDFATLVRYDPQDAITIVGTWTRTGAPSPAPVGDRLPLGGRNLSTLVYQTGRPERIDYDDVSGAIGDAAAREWRLRSSAGVPIRVEGRLWGAMLVAFTREESLPADAEARLAGFTELVVTAVADAQARTELRGFAEEQAALRRVATLVARAAPPEEVFGAVAEEAGRLLGTDSTVMSRYDPDGAATVVGVWARTGTARVLPVGLRLGFGGANVHTLVFQTGRPERIDDYAAASGDAADAARGWGFRSAVGVPISVEDRLWGVMSVASAREEPLSADTEERLAAFTELIVTALVNAEAQAALSASRARIVAAADETRRRLERDLHDGIQQRLVSLALKARTIATMTPQPADEIQGVLSLLADGLGTAMDELREISHGIHPAILSEAGLGPALEALARRSAVPVELDLNLGPRLSEHVEEAGYYIASEAITNVAKHAQASVIDMRADGCDGVLTLSISDDGIGGADPSRGSGIIGLKDRVEALGGTISVLSPPGHGTALHVQLPADPMAASTLPGGTP